jgi:hypothetical protein
MKLRLIEGILKMVIRFEGEAFADEKAEHTR